MRTSKSPFFTVCPSLTGNSMISPLTSGLIITCRTGWILPFATTISVMLRRVTFSVWTVTTGSFFRKKKYHALPPPPASSRTITSQSQPRPFFLGFAMLSTYRHRYHSHLFQNSGAHLSLPHGPTLAKPLSSTGRSPQGPAYLRQRQGRRAATSVIQRHPLNAQDTKRFAQFFDRWVLAFPIKRQG